MKLGIQVRVFSGARVQSGQQTHFTLWGKKSFAEVNVGDVVRVWCWEFRGTKRTKKKLGDFEVKSLAAVLAFREKLSLSGVGTVGSVNWVQKRGRESYAKAEGFLSYDDMAGWASLMGAKGSFPVVGKRVGWVFNR